ncbi:efflux transporter outer membrane subunit [Sulfurisoma sediminicola]|uniref:Multidrug efflux system outer membrane protein n=1 Tax=Sulfurisoma sediminicola TaxID=1381557 RepID=A0A497XET5_9PROT|nr:efflux transporter outer membrane subunit [Sulfurisoma sediminicola]RLJ65055.1 multidrug efflux system outer membrane protein [Sulfurisoma sediminicola]
MNKLLPLYATAALALTLSISGCSLVPEYLRPAAPVPADWPTTTSAANGKTALKFSDDWKAFFPDATLQALISTALEHNRDLKIAVGRVDEARALAGLARADRYPTVDVNAQRSAGLTPADLSGTGRELSTQRYDAAFGITAFELDFWGRVKALDDAARANFLSSEYAQRSFRLTLISDVAASYFSLRELTLRTALSEATALTRKDSRRLIEKRRDVGLSGDLDFYSADGAWQAARAETANLARQKAAAENALRLLVGSNLPAILDAATAADAAFSRSAASEVAVAPPPSFAPPAEIAVELPSEVLLRRPDVLAAEQKLLAANANIGAARAAFFPRISLTGAVGSASRELSGLFDSGSGAWSFIPLLKWPIFDAGRTQANVDLAEARKVIAVAEYERTIQQAFREVADLLDARTRYAEQLAALEGAEKSQAERLQRVDARYRAGVSNYLELHDAQREHFLAQQAMLATRRAWAANAAGLYKALGGA